jgi:hypothetical protein
MDVSLVDPKPPSYAFFGLVVAGLVVIAAIPAVVLTRTRRRFTPNGRR